MSIPVRDNDRIIKITSYAPIFREPPADAPGKFLFQGYNDPIKACNLGIDMPVAQTSMNNISFCLHVLDAVLENYLRWHKQYVVVGDIEQLRLLYAISLLFQFRQRWGWYSNYPSPFVHIDIQTQVMPPDDLLDFNYVMATYDLNERLLKGALSVFSDHAIHAFMLKRHKDPRYKFIQPCMLKPAYWRNPKYWNGFKAGLLVDFVMFKVASRQTRRHLWES